MTPEDHRNWTDLIDLQEQGGCKDISMTIPFARTLLNAALRLAKIEGAGDEEVEKACEALRRGYWTSEDGDSIRPDKHIDAVLDVVASRNATIADLRAKLGEAERFLKFAHESGAAFDTYNYESPEEKSVCEEWRKFLAESEVQGG